MVRIGIKDYLGVEGLTKTFSSTSTKEKGFQGSHRVLVNANFPAKQASSLHWLVPMDSEDHHFIDIIVHIAYNDNFEEQFWHTL
jgi:hypothetical protein